MNRRAVSSLVGAAFFVVLFVLGFNLVLYQLAQYDAYTHQLLTKTQFERERLSENLQIVSFKAGSNVLNLTISNSGGVPIRLVRIWVTNQSANPLWHQGFAVNYVLDPGNTTKNIGSNLGTFSSSKTFVAKIITDRGNAFVALYSTALASAVTSQGAGWITMDWNYYYYERDGNPGNLQPAWCIQQFSTNKVQFYIRVINHWDRDVRILQWSHMKMLQTNGATNPFYIMDPSSTAANPVAYSTKITVYSNPTDQATGGALQQLRFAATAAGGTAGQNVANPPASYSGILVVFYEYSPYGNAYTLAQTIPFEASEITSGSTC